MTKLDDEYTQACLDAIEEIKARSNYNPTRWQQAVRKKGGVQAAKDQLRKPVRKGGTDGGRRLSEAGLDHLSVEWLVLDPRWSGIFNDEDRRLAYEEMTRTLVKLGAAKHA